MQELLAQFRELDDEAKALAVRALRIGVILLFAWVLQRGAGRLLRLLYDRLQRRAGAEELPRIDTLARVFRNAVTALVVLLAGTLVLGELGVSVAPILATAGVAGIAIGFGAQSLVKDYFNGMFLLLDDQLRQGDVVEIAGKGGLVEEVTLRFVRLRDFDGHVHYVPNGEIKVVTNRTRGYAQAVIELRVAYGTDPDAAFAVMREVAQAMRSEPAWRHRLAEDIEIVGVESLAESAVLLRARLRVVPAIEQWNVKREFLKRLLQACAARGIALPVAQLVIADRRG
jgi:moderate conductance mechanosensitive channel